MNILLKKIDWILLGSLVPLLIAGLITMKSFGEGADYFFTRQLIWIVLGVAIFLWLSFSDLSFLRSPAILVILYLVGVLGLLLLFFVGDPVRGAASWFRFGLFSLEPVEPIKIILVLMLAKYFSRRHIDIANIRHIIVSGLYILAPTLLVFLQPDLGSALVIGVLWLGMIMASGISKKHFFSLMILGAIVFTLMWAFALAPYQKDRITAFIDPYIDPQGAGYHTIQTQIAVGAGGLWGRGIGLGTQSRLEFLPEHETDFIFSAFAEEWGFAGVLFLVIFFGLVVWRVLRVGMLGEGNFEKLFAIGLGILLIAQFFIHVGMNVGLMPITGLSLPFVSYGGSSLITLFASLGILSSFPKRP